MRFDGAAVTSIEPVIPPFEQVRGSGSTMAAYDNARAQADQRAAGSQWYR